MAEEITYIPYGLDEISQLDLMTSLANGVESYLGSKRWAKKDKYRNAWLQAYLNIINAGLTGASNESGVWKINHNGTAFPVDTMSNIDREMYLDAAYYIQLQMAKMTPRVKEEELKKEDLVPFKFLESFNKQFLNDYFGGSSELFADPNLGWNTFDARGEDGLRPTTERRLKMLLALQKYLDSLEDNKYNFEGTSFTDIEDARTKIKTAIDALGTPEEEDDIPAFNALGLKYRNYFSNGGNEDSGKTDKEGNPLTWNEWNKYKLQLALTKSLVAKLNAYNNTIFLNRVTNSKMLGQNPQALKEKYKDSNSLLSALQGYAQKDIRTLTPDEQSEILGAYRYLAKLPIDNNLYNQIILSSSGLYRGAAPSRFKKINGIDNLIWDDLAKQIIQVNNRLQLLAILNLPTDLFTNVQTVKDKEQEYLNSKIPGITNAEWKELSAIGLDIASIVDPEAITGSVMATGAAALRHSAKNDSNPDWSVGDYFLQGLDYATGILGGIPLLGDSILGAKTAATLAKATPILRKIGRLGAWTDLFQTYPDLKEATRKITSGEELTIKDWRAIGQGLRGLISHGRLNRGNRAERRVLEKSGQNVTPENISSIRGKALNYSLKLGFTRTKPTNTSEVSTIKATVNGKESEIEISSNAKARIQEKVLKAGNNTEARNKAVKEVLESEGKIKASDKIEVEAPTYRDWKHAPGWLGTSRNLFGTKQVSSLLGNNVFNDYISGNRSYWDRYKYGSNTELKGIYNRLNSNQISKPSEETSKTSLSNVTKKETPLTSELATELKQNVKSWRQEHKDILNIRKNKGRDYEWSKNDVGTNPDKLKSNIKLGDKELNIEIASDGILTINGEKTSINGFGKNGKQEVRKKIKEIVLLTIKQQRLKRNTEEFKKLVLELKKLKSSGFLKQGGQINPSLDTIIEDFLKNNNI